MKATVLAPSMQFNEQVGWWKSVTSFLSNRIPFSLGILAYPCWKQKWCPLSLNSLSTTKADEVPILTQQLNLSAVSSSSPRASFVDPNPSVHSTLGTQKSFCCVQANTDQGYRN